MGIKEIAAAANVSPATVSNVLNGKNNVSVETRERILELCEAMGYSAGRHGKHNIKSLNPDPQISRYISKLSQQLAEYTRDCRSGNKLLDVMIHKYNVDCEMRGIRFEYDVKLCNLKELEDIDLVAILGNLVDNAITAAEKSERKTISLATAKRNSYSIIIISNSRDTPPKENSGMLATTKSDREFHGFGLKSVKKTLKKYEGDFEWDYDEINRIFTITVMVGDPIKNNAIVQH